MNRFTAKKYLTVAILALVLSLVFIRWHSQDGVPFCVNSAGCSARETLRGKVTTTTYGYPAPYRQVEKFNPANTNEASGGYAGYKEARIETQKLNILNIVANFVFWFALLHVLARFIRQKKSAAAAPTASSPAAPVSPTNSAPQSPIGGDRPGSVTGVGRR